MFIFGILRKYLIIAGVLGAVGFGLWKYYTYTQETIRVYAENAARAEMAQAETQAALEQTIKDLEKVQEKYNQVSADFNSAKKRVDGLQDKLKEHDLDFLAEQKPGLVEKILDKASKDMLRCLEIISGSPLTEEELNVTTKAKQILSVLTLLTLTIFLTSCGSVPKSVTYKAEPIDRPKLVLPETKTLNMRNVDFMILTRQNVEEKFKEIEERGDPIVIFGLKAQHYEDLSLNIADILELLSQQESVIVAYREYYEQTEKVIEENNQKGEVEIPVETEGSGIDTIKNLFK